MEQDDLLRLVRRLRAQRRREEAQHDAQTTLLKEFHAYQFYQNICEELLRYAEDIHVKSRMAERKQREVDILRRRCNEIREIDVCTYTLRQMKTLAHDITRFYVNRYPLRCCASRTSELGIVNWRWLHLTERAQRWQAIARSHDWSKALHIHPKDPQDEDWWDRTPSSAVSLFAADNPYTISSL